MPFPDPTGYYNQQQQVAGGTPDLSYLNHVPQSILDTFGYFGVDGAPPQHIIDYLSSVGTPWDSTKYSWDPMTGKLTDRSSGGAWDMRSVPNNSLPSYVVLQPGMNPTAESSLGAGANAELGNRIYPGATAYAFEPGQGPTFFGQPGGGQAFFSNDPSAIDEYQHDANTRRNQAIAQIAAMAVGGAAAGAASGGLPAGASVAPNGLITGAGIPAAALTGGTGAVGGGLLPGVAAGAGGLSGITAGNVAGSAANVLDSSGSVIPGTEGGTGGIGNALGGAGSALENWLPYITSGINTLLGTHTANQAMDAEAEAMQAAIAEQRRQYDDTVARQEPWMAAGRDALGQLQNPQQNFLASPGYEWARNEGQRGIQNTFAARGGVKSGNALKALADFNTGLAQQDYGNWWNQQAGRAGLGQTAVQNTNNVGANSANQTSNYLSQGGAARAAGLWDRGSIVGQNLNDAVTNWLYRRRAA